MIARTFFFLRHHSVSPLTLSLLGFIHPNATVSQQSLSTATLYIVYSLQSIVYSLYMPHEYTEMIKPPPGGAALAFNERPSRWSD